MIEPLELRIAPATLLNPKTVQYTDPDGDTVLVKLSKGSWELNEDFVFAASGNGEILRKLDLADQPRFAGAKITITASGPGNGQTVVGFIDATNVDLAAVSVDGDLGRITAGNPYTSTPALGSLDVQSMGVSGLGPQGGAGVLAGFFAGAVGSIKIHGNVVGTDLSMSSVKKIEIGGDFVGAGAFSGINGGSLGKVIIRGSLIGGNEGFSGRISAREIGSVSIGGALIGAQGMESGSINARDRIGSAQIGESITGGAGERSGSIRSGEGGMGSVKVGKAIYGGTGTGSGSIATGGMLKLVETGTADPEAGGIYGNGAGTGSIYAFGSLEKAVIRGSLFGGSGESSGKISGYSSIGQVTVQGSVQGGSANNTGSIESEGPVKKVVVTGSLFGGLITGAQTAFYSGFIGGKVIGSVSIGKDIYGGTDASTGSFVHSAAIMAERSIGSITVGGDMNGSSSRVTISAFGAIQQSMSADLAIGSIKIGGSLIAADILAGYDQLLPVNADAQIGSITVGKDVRATNLVAGIARGTDAFFGDTNDQPITDSTDLPIASKIASIVIGGVVEGTAGGGDRFGFVANYIGSLKIGGASIALTTGAFNDGTPKQLAATTGDVFLREVISSPVAP